MLCTDEAERGCLRRKCSTMYKVRVEEQTNIKHYNGEVQWREHPDVWICYLCLDSSASSRRKYINTCGRSVKMLMQRQMQIPKWIYNRTTSAKENPPVGSQESRPYSNRDADVHTRYANNKPGLQLLWKENGPKLLLNADGVRSYGRSVWNYWNQGSKGHQCSVL